jgi:hypothetical protein
MINFNKILQEQFNKMCSTGKLFRSSLTGQKIWDLYIESFHNDPIFRDPNSSEHNCNLCNNFIRRYGNIVAIDKDFRLMTLWDIDLNKEADEYGEYLSSCNEISNALSLAPIQNVFFETFNELNSLNYEKCNENNSNFQLGIKLNHKRYTKEDAEKFGVVKANEIRTFNHMNLQLPKEFVDTSNKSIESIMGEYRDAKNVFQRAMNEIPLDTLYLTKDLINQDSLLDGKTHLYKINEIIPLKKEYDEVSNNLKDNYCWVASYKLPFAKFKNELIGVFCSELAEGEEINKACQSWNKRVDPVNYMKATAPITQKQIENAKKFVEENGYEESFDRRFATIDDIITSEILYRNDGDGKIKSISIFDNVKSSKSRHKRNEFDKVEEVTIEKFMKDILPSCTSVEAYLENKMEGNLVTLTTANNPNSKKIFKWDNNYSKTFNGNLAGKSMIKEAVKKAGGKVDGVLRFSISWNEDGRSICDFDAHAIQPNGDEIYYGSYKGIHNKNSMSGFLDVDMIRPDKMGVENITWIDKSKMNDGSYRFFNRNYDGGNNTGFKAEIEFDGELYSYEYNKPVNGKKDIDVAIVTLKDGHFSIEHKLPEIQSAKELYDLETNQFHKVNLVCLSPNHWGDNNVGNKYYLFMLDNCKTSDKIRSFHNEDLIPELITHRKVMEVLGATNMLEPTDKQLSGLGFNATVRDEVILKLGGNFKRVIKVKF